MAKFVIATLPMAGHVNPGVPIAQGLIAQGHEVRWYSGKRYREKIEGTGARFLPMITARDFDDSDLNASFPGREQLKDLNLLRFDLKHIFFKPMMNYYEDMQRILSDFPADVVVYDTGFTGMIPFQLEGKGPKMVSFGVMPLTLSSIDTAPFGLGLPPNSSPIGRLRNRALNLFVQKGAFASIQKYANQILTAAGMPELRTFFMDAPVQMADLYLQGTCPSFEYRRTDLPKTVRFVGPFLPNQSTPYEKPDWWEQMKDGHPVVHVTQGTIDNSDLNKLLIPTIEALANENVWVIATTGGRPIEEVRIPLPNNVRLEKFIPHAHLLPHVDVMVTNAGYGGVQQALSFGIPILGVGDSEDKPEVCARIQWSGVGIRLKKGFSKNHIQEAVRDLLNSPSYKSKAKSLQQEFKNYKAYELAPKLLTDLAMSKS